MRTIALALALVFAGSAPALAKKHRARAHKTAKHKAKRGKSAHAAAAPVTQADDDEVPGQRRH